MSKYRRGSIPLTPDLGQTSRHLLVRKGCKSADTLKSLPGVGG